MLLTIVLFFCKLFLPRLLLPVPLGAPLPQRPRPILSAEAPCSSSMSFLLNSLSGEGQGAGVTGGPDISSFPHLYYQ